MRRFKEALEFLYSEDIVLRSPICIVLSVVIAGLIAAMTLLKWWPP